MSGSRHAGGCYWALLAGAFALILATPGAGFAEEPAAAPLSPAAAPAPTRSEVPKTVLSWETGAGRSYVIPAVEVVGYLFVLNQYDRHFVDPHEVYRTGTHSFWKNLTDSTWVVDTDPFATNQFLHPLGGTIYYGLPRSTGLNYWESLAYATAGSFLWELGGETGPPSINDMITTPIGGSFLGEPLFRMASLLLESGGGAPGFWRELGAAVISPPTGFNRLVFGNRFGDVFPSRAPAVFTRVELGASLTALEHNPISFTTRTIKQDQGTADFSMAYGLPGKPGYSYTRPFDYFDFQFRAASANTFENIMTRGLLYGTSYASGDAYRGVWGLYGSYDYLSPQVFRVSSTALSLGTTGQWWLSDAIALQGTALGGLGYGAAGVIHGVGERDYHYGATPQGLLALRLLLGEVAMLDVTGREYYVSGVGSTERRGSETIGRGTASFTVRVYGRHALAVQYIASERDAHYPDIPNRHQSVGTISLAYVFLGDTRFGAVEWRAVDAAGR
ncbi:MAG: DUF3943 domain-containing protein [Nitrospirae bacterium]|nr:MAG: DUF3943 domain-containing protein [Nitrospirota bacterium]